jgi:negative regulator of flagellin synthesis FlgM
MSTVQPPDIGKIIPQNISENSRLQKSRAAADSDTALQPMAPEQARQARDLALSESIAVAMKTAEFDEGRVQQISEAIRLGNYPLDAKKIAESFVPLEKLL